MNTFLDYLNTSQVSLQKEIQELQSDNRTDDANLVKIKCNMYDIAKAFYSVAAKVSSKDNLKEEFEKRIRKPYDSWKLSYEKAKEHNDVEKLVIEEIKMKTLDEIIEKFKQY